MIVRRFMVPVLAATLVVGACKKEPPPPPAPVGPTPEELAQMRADSIARAEAAAAEAARAEEQRRMEAERARRAAVRDAREALEAMVFFDFDESAIRPDQEGTLRRKADVLRASPQVQLLIEGHADERGSTEYNLALGNRRAEAVRQYLVGFGLSESRFSIVSYGEERPLVNRSDEAAWARNRRAQFVITAGGNAINPPN